MVGGQLVVISNPTPGWAAQRWKVIISQRLTHRSESSDFHIKFPCLGIWHWEGEPPEHLALRASGAYAEEPRDHGRDHRLLCALDPRAKQRLHRNLGQTCMLFLEDDCVSL